MNALESSSTRPYLIRALYDWCTDNGFTPYVAVLVDDTVQVPREYVKNGEIVLNISFDATSSLKLGNDFIEFKARFAGSAREIMVPVNRVIAIYAERLKQRGHTVTVVARPRPIASLKDKLKSVVNGKGWPIDPNTLPDHFDNVDVDLRVIESRRPIEDRDVPDADVVIATWWETAPWVAKLSPSKGAKRWTASTLLMLSGTVAFGTDSPDSN